MTGKKFIDIESVLKEKSPKTYKFLPGFVMRWLKRKLHEDDINTTMNCLDQYRGLEYNSEIIKYLNVKVEVVNPENIPLTGGVIFASNHPLGGFDGMALIKAIGDVRSDVRFIVNDILRNLKNFGDVFVGVNKVGSSSRNSLKDIDELYASESAVLVFPAGLVSRKQEGGIKDLEWSKSFITKAIKYNKPIVPIYIEGRNTEFFYNLAKWRKRFGIKANIEMMLLPDEMFKQRGKTIRIHVGKAIASNTFDKLHTEKQWAALLKKHVYSNEIDKGVNFKA